MDETAQAICGGTAVRVIAVSACDIFACDTCFVAHRIVVNKEESSIVENGVAPCRIVGPILTPAHKAKRFGIRGFMRRDAGGAQGIESERRRREIGLGQWWD